MKLQKTKLDNFINKILILFSTALVGPWKKRSIGLISLLVGFYLGSNLTVYFLEALGNRALVVLIIALIIEILIRLRTTVKSESWPTYWLSIDNLRLGFTYSLVLEAFKLGS